MRKTLVMKHKIAKLIILALYISYNSIATAEAQEKSSKIADLMDHYSDYKGFNGTVLVAENNKIIFKRAYGYANFEWEIENTIETKFRIASITKSFTAIMIMQQCEAGNIELDATISDFLPDYPEPAGKQVTIHNLLTHSSGIIDFEDVPEFTSVLEREYHSTGDLFKYFQDKDLLFEPGNQFKYSNFNYVVLAVILEKVSGLKYEDLIQKMIFAPAGMSNTSIDDNFSVVKNRASGYYQEFLSDKKENATYVDMSVVIGAGDICSTVEDMFRFDQALSKNKLISKESLDIILTPNAFPNMQNYGYGWDIRGENWGPDKEEIIVYGSAGSINGFKSNFRRFDNGNCVVVLSNYKDRSGTSIEITGTQEIVNDISAILYGREYTLPAKSIASLIGRSLASGNTKFLDEIKNTNFKNLPDNIDLNGEDIIDLCLYYQNHGQDSSICKIMRLDLTDLCSTSVGLTRLAAFYCLSGEISNADKALSSCLEINEYGDALLIFVANEFSASSKPEAALYLLQKNINAFPESARAFEYYAEALLKNDEIEAAVINFKKSLKLDPDNKNIIKKLEELEK